MSPVHVYLGINNIVNFGQFHICHLFGIINKINKIFCDGTNVLYSGFDLRTYDLEEEEGVVFRVLYIL